MDQILSYKPDDNDDYYNILGCSELSTEEQITTEYRARVLDCHPDKHPNDPKAADRFTLLSKAKETLTNTESRTKYDKWRRSGISISYGDWCGMRDSVHTSMHWATKAPQPSLVAPGDATASSASSGARSHDLTTAGTASHTKRDRSPSPRQASPYHKAHCIDLSSKERQCGANKQVDWTPQAATGLLQKFRNYEI